MKDKIINFIKKEVVLTIAIFLAIATCFLVPVDKEYFNYLDYNTLICLFSMLAVVAGLKSTNVFDVTAKRIIKFLHTRRAVIYFLVFGTFFFDMIVANDMSLITFLPLTYIILHSTRNDKYLAVTFVLQTIAANMGGMITPYGNPQNLYLYSYYNIGTIEFFSILLKQSIVVAVLLFICCSFIKNDHLRLKNDLATYVNKKKLIVYVLLFIMVILSIFRFIPYLLTLFVVTVTILIMDKKRFKEIDYALIATFFVFFIFSGNMARISGIKEFISGIVVNNTLIAGIISCQFISNVPTAIFLSKFTTNYSELLISVNVGSLGILISSLASLITLKEYLKHRPKGFWKYLGIFTFFNTLFLIIVLLVTVVIK